MEDRKRTRKVDHRRVDTSEAHGGQCAKRFKGYNRMFEMSQNIHLVKVSRFWSWVLRI